MNDNEKIIEDKNLEEEIINAYTNIKPSEDLINKVVNTSVSQRKSQAVWILFTEYGLSAAVVGVICCIRRILGSGVDSGDSKSQVASTFSNSNAIFLGVTTFFILCTIFTLIYMKKVSKTEKDK